MMNPRPPSLRSVARGALVLTFFQILSKVFLAVFKLLLGRRSLVSDLAYGRFEGIKALVEMFTILSDGGLESYNTRELARDPETFRQRLPHLLSLKLLLTLLACAFLIVWLAMVEQRNPGQEESLSFWIYLGACCYLLALSGQSWFRSITRAYDRMDIEGWMNLIEKVALLLLGSLALVLGGKLIGILWSFSLAALGAAGYALWQVSFLEKTLKPSLPVEIAVLQTTYPFALGAICVSLFYNMDRIMLLHLGDIAVARYSRGLNLILLLLLFPQMVSVSLYPALSRLKQDLPRRMEISHQFLMGLMLLAFPALTGGWLVAGPLVDWLFGSAGSQSLSWSLDALLGWDTTMGNHTEAAVFRILLLGLPFTYCNYLFGPALNAHDLQLLNLKASAITAGVNITFNLVLIPFLGPVGAALATTLTQAVYAALMYVGLRRVDPSWFKGIPWFRMFMVCLVMAGVVVALSPQPVLVRVVVGMVVYLLFGWWWNLIKIPDRSYFR